MRGHRRFPSWSGSAPPQRLPRPQRPVSLLGKLERPTAVRVEGRGSASPAECRGASPCSSRGLVSQQNAGPPPCSGESGPATALPPYCDPGAGKGPQRGSREGNYPYCVARSATPSSIPPCLNADCDSDQLHGHLDFTTHGKGPGPQCTHRPDVASAPVPPAVRVALTQEPLWTDCQIY